MDRADEEEEEEEWDDDDDDADGSDDDDDDDDVGDDANDTVDAGGGWGAGAEGGKPVFTSTEVVEPPVAAGSSIGTLCSTGWVTGALSTPDWVKEPSRWILPSTVGAPAIALIILTSSKGGSR